MGSSCQVQFRHCIRTSSYTVRCIRIPSVRSIRTSSYTTVPFAFAVWWCTQNTHTHARIHYTRKSGKRNDRGSFERVPVDSEQQQQHHHHCYYGSSSGAVCYAMAADLLDICSQTSVSATSVDSQASSGTKLGFTACFLQRVGVCCCWWVSSSSSCRQRQWFSVGKLFRVAGGVVLCLFLSVYFSKLVLSRANELGRQCILGGGGASTRESGSFNGGGGSGDRHVDGDVEQGRQRSLEMLRSYRFAMVTCSDGSRTNPQRSFEGLMELVTPNKRSYVARHGYEFVDASDVLDKERPPSWSKILAVRKSLPHYDWVFWNDADSVVTNPAISLEEIIHSVVGDTEPNNMPDFIITKDVTGVNAGMFFFRNSEWSRNFLDLWWNQTAFVQPFGRSKSGDNDALKHLLEVMPEHEQNQHVRIPHMQCLFNSNLWKLSWRSGRRLITMTKTIWQGVYSKGDFMVHLAGLDDKKKLIEEVLHDIEGGERSTRRLKV